MKFSEEVINHLLNGATIISHKKGSDCDFNAILIRLRKEHWAEFQGTHFEYLECHNSIMGAFDHICVMTYRNGHVREVKRKFEKSFYEDLFIYKRHQEKSVES